MGKHKHDDFSSSSSSSPSSSDAGEATASVAKITKAKKAKMGDNVRSLVRQFPISTLHAHGLGRNG